MAEQMLSQSGSEGLPVFSQELRLPDQVELSRSDEPTCLRVTIHSPLPQEISMVTASRTWSLLPQAPIGKPVSRTFSLPRELAFSSSRLHLSPGTLVPISLPLPI